MPKVRFGVQTGQQETTWPQLRETWLELEELGFDDLWVYDHYLPTGTTLEDGDVTDAWSLLAALSQVVKRPRLGTLVTSATFRHPAALAKIAATVDHASNGRVILGIGAGWHRPSTTPTAFPSPALANASAALKRPSASSASSGPRTGPTFMVGTTSSATPPSSPNPSRSLTRPSSSAAPAKSSPSPSWRESPTTGTGTSPAPPKTTDAN